MAGILWAILVVWLIGLLADVAGNAVHLLLLIALAVLIYNLVTGRRTL